MAVTKIMKIGTAASTGGKYLYNSINYILNREKPKAGYMWAAIPGVRQMKFIRL